MTLRFPCAFLFLIATAHSHAQTTIHGRVIDSVSAQPVAFVSVTLQDGRHGVNSDMEGNFALRIPAGYDGWVYFSHVSYQKFKLPLKAFRGKTVVKLKAGSTVLSEFTVFSGENPAFKIIRQAIEHRKENDPENLSAYSYTSYSKFIISPSEPNHKTDSIMQALRQRPDSVKLTKDQKSMLQFDAIADSANLFLSESVSTKKVLHPGQVKEELLAYRISGYKSPMFSSAAMDGQPFAFYDENINLFGKDFINPLQPGTFRRYDFNLVDTTFYQADTVYVIQFAPRDKKLFNGLEGILSIAVDGYAVKNVAATTADPAGLVGIRIQQEYEKIDGHWFPVQLNTDLDFHDLVFAGRSMRAQQLNFLRDVRINPELNKKEFGDIVMDLAPVRKDLNASILETHRIRPLERRELNTYTFLDSAMRKVRWLDGVFEALVTGTVPVGWADVDLSKVMSFNAYESVRFGMGLYTNDRVSKLVRVGGYYGYGISDQESKYGGEVKLTFNRNRDLYLRMSYAHDIYETGSLHDNKEGQYLSSASFRQWTASRFDRINNYKTELGYRILPSIHARLSLSHQQIRPTYPYTLEVGGEPADVFNITEAAFTVRYVRREHYTSLRGKKIFLTHKFPVVTFTLTKAIPLFDASDFNYTIYDVAIKHQTKYSGFGKTVINLTGGVVDGVAPYGKLFNGRGAKTSSFYVESYFQTMGLYEFAASRYAGLFLRHNFGNVLINKKYSKPELLIFQNAAIGSLDHRQLHTDLLLQSMDKGYLESGVGMDNIIRIPYFGLGFFNFGGSVFYRYGPYRFVNQQDNFAYRINFTFTF